MTKFENIIVTLKRATADLEVAHERLEELRNGAPPDDRMFKGKEKHTLEGFIRRAKISLLHIVNDIETIYPE